MLPEYIVASQFRSHERTYDRGARYNAEEIPEAARDALVARLLGEGVLQTKQDFDAEAEEAIKAAARRKVAALVDAKVREDAAKKDAEDSAAAAKLAAEIEAAAMAEAISDGLIDAPVDQPAEKPVDLPAAVVVAEAVAVDDPHRFSPDDSRPF